jgi:hypothetical protein
MFTSVYFIFLSPFSCSVALNCCCSDVHQLDRTEVESALSSSLELLSSCVWARFNIIQTESIIYKQNTIHKDLFL